MKTLLKNYIDLLSLEKVKKFALKNNITLSDNNIEFILELLKNNFDEILIDDSKYLDIIKNNIDEDNFIKIKELYLYYKNRYKGYLI